MSIYPGRKKTPGEKERTAERMKSKMDPVGGINAKAPGLDHI